MPLTTGFGLAQHYHEAQPGNVESHGNHVGGERDIDLLRVTEVAF
jgi:hypothetical protein